MQAIGDGCTGVELGQRLHVSKQAAAPTAKALETMGLVDRHGDALDRRARIIRPTHEAVKCCGDPPRRSKTRIETLADDRRKRPRRRPVVDAGRDHPVCLRAMTKHLH